jgi:hypothetical protein
MGAPTDEKSSWQAKIGYIMTDNTTLCISGELKENGEGQPASNFRFNKDKETNETVIDNYFFLFHTYKGITHGKPIIVTTIPRSWRKYSYSIKEDGIIVRKDDDYRRKGDKGGQYYYSGHPGGCPEAFDGPDTKLMKFLENSGVSQGAMIKLRESCKGARYNTYLIDMVSFLYQLYIGTKDFHNLFEVNYRKPSACPQMVEPVGKWSPIEGHSYLYFEETSDSAGYVFFTPKKESVDQIYRDLDSALSSEDNEVKQRIRNHLCSNLTSRWTDFDVNDTDDAFTILMMIYAFSSFSESLTEIETKIMNELEESMKPWFAQL